MNLAASERALERVLVTQGALLLPSGVFEIEPAVTYSRVERSFSNAVGTTPATSQIRQNNYIGDVALRAGLPWDSEFQVDVPYRFIDQTTVTSVGLTGVASSSASGGGLSDMTASLAKTLLREHGWVPDLIAAVVYSKDSGGSVDGFSFGNGFDQVGASLTATKRVDPLAFIGSVAFLKGLDIHNFSPGNEYDVNLGVDLAASPETSLRFLVQQRFLDDGTRNGTTVIGSGLTQSAFVTGASVIVAPGVLLDVSAGVGLTSDSPKYFVRVGLPIRF